MRLKNKGIQLSTGRPDRWSRCLWYIRITIHKYKMKNNPIIILFNLKRKSFVEPHQPILTQNAIMQIVFFPRFFFLLFFGCWLNVFGVWNVRAKYKFTPNHRNETRNRQCSFLIVIMPFTTYPQFIRDRMNRTDECANMCSV